MSARDIIVNAKIEWGVVKPIGKLTHPVSITGEVGESITDQILQRLDAAGYRILKPGELDPDTLEAAAKVADEEVDIMRHLHAEARGDNVRRTRFASRALEAAFIRETIRALPAGRTALKDRADG